MIGRLKKEEFLAQVNAAIEQLVSNKELSAIHVADKLCMHPQQLHRHLKVLAGMSSSEYITKYRIDLAKQLLLRNDVRAIADVGYKCGFDEPTHFSRFFKRVTGMTPGEFRKIHKA